MADIDMTDAPSGSSIAPKKAVGKAKAGGEGGADGKKRFEVKKVSNIAPETLLILIAKQWNAVALWAWDIVVDNCAICRNHIMDLCMFRDIWAVHDY